MFFPSDIASSFFEIVCLLWVLSEMIGSNLVPKLRRKSSKIDYRDKGSQYIFTGGIFLSVAISFLFALYKILMLPPWITYMGTSLMILGIVIRQWSVAILGGFFSPTVGIQKGQKIVTTGPYRFVRHPSYTGSFFITMGFGIALQSLGAIIVILCLSSFVFSYRIKLEEHVLIAEFGNDYSEYSKKTKMLIPYIY